MQAAKTKFIKLELAPNKERRKEEKQCELLFIQRSSLGDEKSVIFMELLWDIYIDC